MTTVVLTAPELVVRAVEVVEQPYHSKALVEPNNDNKFTSRVRDLALSSYNIYNYTQAVINWGGGGGYNDTQTKRL